MSAPTAGKFCTLTIQAREGGGTEEETSNSGDVFDNLSLTTCLGVDTTYTDLESERSGANLPYNRQSLYMQRIPHDWCEWPSWLTGATYIPTHMKAPIDWRLAFPRAGATVTPERRIVHTYKRVSGRL